MGTDSIWREEMMHVRLSIEAEEREAKRWTKRDTMKLQSLTRKITKMDGGDHNIQRMAYECEVRACGDSANGPAKP